MNSIENILSNLIFENICKKEKGNWKRNLVKKVKKRCFVYTYKWRKKIHKHLFSCNEITISEFGVLQNKLN